MLSDCEKCWDTPCGCGWGYRHYSDESFKKFVDEVTEGRKKIRESPEFKAEIRKKKRDHARSVAKKAEWEEELQKRAELRKLYDPSSGKWRKP